MVGQLTRTNAPRWGFWKSANDQPVEQENSNRSQINVFLLDSVITQINRNIYTYSMRPLVREAPGPRLFENDANFPHKIKYEKKKRM